MGARSERPGEVRKIMEVREENHAGPWLYPDERQGGCALICIAGEASDIRPNKSGQAGAGVGSSDLGRERTSSQTHPSGTPAFSALLLSLRPPSPGDTLPSLLPAAIHFPKTNGSFFLPIHHCSRAHPLAAAPPSCPQPPRPCLGMGSIDQRPICRLSHPSGPDSRRQSCCWPGQPGAKGRRKLPHPGLERSPSGMREWVVGIGLAPAQRGSPG